VNDDYDEYFISFPDCFRKVVRRRVQQAPSAADEVLTFFLTQRYLNDDSEPSILTLHFLFDFYENQIRQIASKKARALLSSQNGSVGFACQVLSENTFLTLFSGRSEFPPSPLCRCLAILLSQSEFGVKHVNEFLEGADFLGR